MAWYIGGPQGYKAVVWRHEDIEPVIKALCTDGKHDPDDFTATDVSGAVLSIPGLNMILR